MLRLCHRLLFLLPPELAHHIAVFFLKGVQFVLRIRGKRIPGPFAIHIPSLPQIYFSNRLGLAAGFDKNAEVFAALSYLGFGFLEVGTVTPFAQPGNPKPRLFRVRGTGLINRMGFNNAGGAIFLENIRRYRQMVRGVPLFANIGKNKTTPLEQAHQDYENLFNTLKDVVDGFVVNISSPNTPGLRELQNEDFLERIAALAPAHLPTLVKLSPDLSEEKIQTLLEFIERTPKFGGVVLTNTSQVLAQTIFGEEGGFSGDLLFEKSVEYVALARSILSERKVIIGVGGVHSVERAKQMRAAGADLIEIYTSFVYGGVDKVKELSKALS
jgi:dihydroorotate dehydrogenase